MRLSLINNTSLEQLCPTMNTPRTMPRPAFSYVGPSQVFAWLGFGVLRLASRRARAAQALPQPERSVPAGVVVPDMFPSAVVGASKQPRRFHSAIRAQEIKSLAHEILYGEIDAHSRSRAHTAVEALAQKGARAVDPDPALRGFDDSLLGCNHGGPARLIHLAFDDRGPHPTEQFAGNADGGRFLAGRAAHLEPHLLDAWLAADGHPGSLLQDPAQVARSGFGDVALALFPAAGEDPRMQAGVAGDGLAIAETTEVSHLRQHR